MSGDIFTLDLGGGSNSKENKYISTQGSPYTLVIAIYSKNNLGGVIFKNIKLLNNEKEIFFKDIIRKQMSFKKAYNAYYSIVIFKNITTEYKELSLSLEFQLENDEKIYKINRKFEKSYHEEHNTAFGILMQN